MSAAGQLLLGGIASPGGAILSEDGLYRYRLWRRWGTGPHALWVMLNPSTADANQDDPTIRKCMGFAKLWGFEGIEVVNLFAWRSTSPDAIRMVADPVGPENDVHIREAAAKAPQVVAGWGRAIPRQWLPRVRDVLALLGEVHCLGLTDDQQPRHPLMVAYATPLISLRVD